MKRRLNINIACILFISSLFLTFFIVYSLNKTVNTLFQNKEKVYSVHFDQINNEKRTLKYQFPRPGDTPNFTNVAHIKKNELQQFEKDIKKIIIYRLTGNWYKVYFNDILIGTMGDVKDNHSDIWNNLGVFNISDEFIKEDNQIRIESYNEYEFGLLGYPIIITTNTQAIKIQNWVYILLFGVNLVIMGTMIFTFVILIILSMFIDYKIKKIDYSYILYAFSILITALTIFDHIQVNTIALPLLNYKKLITAGYYIPPILTSMALTIRFNSKSLKIISVILFISISYLIIVPQNVIDLKKTYDITNYFILLTVLLWIRITFINFKKSFYAKVIFGGSIAQLVFAGYDIINFALGNPFNNFYTYGLFIFSISVVGVVISDIVRIMGTLEFEKKRSQILYQKSIRDGMTNVYNHQHIHSILKEIKSDYTILLIDIDDFKHVNDNFGHLAGDAVIKRVATFSKKAIKNNDLVGRYGGDEFIIILFDLDRDSVIRFTEDLKNKIEQPFIFEEHKIKPSLSIGIFTSKNNFNYEKVISMADKGLYEAKKRGKSRIVEYTE